MRATFILLLLIVLGSAALGWRRRTDLLNLRSEAGRLEHLEAPGTKVTRDREEAGDGSIPDEASLPVPAEEIDAAFSRWLKSRSEALQTTERDVQVEMERDYAMLCGLFLRMAPSTFQAFLERVKSNDALPGDSGDLALSVYTSCLPPGKAMELIMRTQDSSKRQDWIFSVFHKWARINPSESVRWYEEQKPGGEPWLLDSRLVDPLLQAESRLHPDRALKLALEVDAGQQENFAMMLPEVLVDEAEHARFLAALRRAEAASPSDEALRQIRARYVAQLSASLGDWTFPDATALIDGEFTAEEKRQAARNLAAYGGGLQEPEKWANWFQHLGDDLNPGGTVRIFLMSWIQSDHVAAGTWIGNYPEGEAKQQMMVSYLGQIMQADPAAARRSMQRMPEGKHRTKVEQMLRDYEK